MSGAAMKFTGILTLIAGVAAAADVNQQTFFKENCFECHDAETKKGNLDLSALKPDFADRELFPRWVKVHDRIRTGEMPPPKKKERPAAAEVAAVTKSLRESLLTGESARLDAENRTALRRLTRGEYENTMRDLFSLSGIALQADLPADGSAHGFDNNSDALDISHVNLAKYLESADRVLDLAIATKPHAPSVQKHRVFLSEKGLLLQGDGVALKDKRPDPDLPPAGEQRHLGVGAHERMGLFRNGSSVALFRHEDDSVAPYFNEFIARYQGMYRMRISVWSFMWDKGEVLPARNTEAVRISVGQIMPGKGPGGHHPSYMLDYFDAPSIESKEHDFSTWLNVNELIGFDLASITASTANYARKGHAMSFTGPGIACDWLDVEGPFNDVWPPVSHRVLFDNLPLVETQEEATKKKKRAIVGARANKPDPDEGAWTVHSDQPHADAQRLLASFLPKAFRRPVEAGVLQQYVAMFDQRVKAGDSFVTAMRRAYSAALTSPDFLHHVEPAGPLDDHALASRLAYFLWNSMPDEQLIKLAANGTLHTPTVLHDEVERLLNDAKSQRFINDFTGQWLKLRLIAANDPDKKLYPEFSSYLQNSMVGETRAYFRELIEKDLDARHLVKSDFAMLNEKLAAHYEVPGVTGAKIHRVALPKDSPRGGFLTQAAVLKVTANGTTTSPVPRGAFVMANLLGDPPDPPPSDVPAIEPDVRGTQSIREQLAKHREDASCASCHAKIDPAGFALESFDVIGGFRDHYRSIGEGEPAPRGRIESTVRIHFTLGQKVDPSGVLPDERKFSDIRELQSLLAAHPEPLLRNLLQQFAIYATGRDIAFRDRDAIEAIVAATQKKGGGIRTLIHELTGSPLFQTR